MRKEIKGSNSIEKKITKKNKEKQDKIIEMALVLLNKDGLNNLGLRKLATALEIQAPALYWYFKSKDSLIDYMAEKILKDEFEELKICSNKESWQNWLISVMNRLRKAMLSYTDGARVVAGAHLYPAETLAKILDLSIGSLNNAGLQIKTARNVVMTCITYTFGYVIEEQASPSFDDYKESDLDLFLYKFPMLYDSVKEAMKSFDGEIDFNEGLNLIIRGVV